jgi:site-specific DNA recombinase
VIKEFVDEAETGRTSSRPAFREMISLARRPNKPFDVILVWKYSRFARSREDSNLYKAMLKKAGVQVISISEPFDNSPTGRLMEAIIESLDEFYSDNLGEDVTRGMMESASWGFYLSAKPPYGYRKVKVRDGNKERTKLEPDSAEANIVKSMFKDIISGKGLTDIVRGLNTRGIPGPRGKGVGENRCL